MKKLAVSILIFVVSSGGASALDLGQTGHVYPIAEEDVRQRIARDLTPEKVGRIWQELRDSGANALRNLQAYQLGVSSSDETYFVDLSVILGDDIWAPKMDDEGNVEWVQLAAKGQRVSPFERVRPPQRMLFINGKDLDQVEFARQLIGTHPFDILPVLTQGDPKALSDDFGYPVYYLNDYLMRRFKLRHVPALAGPGLAENYKELQVDVFSKPFSLDRARALLDADDGPIYVDPEIVR